MHHHYDRSAFIECDPRLPENLGRNEILVLRNNAASVNDAEIVPEPMGFAVQTVAGDARFIADNGPARTHQAVEQSGFADIGPADDGDKRNFVHWKFRRAWLD